MVSTPRYVLSISLMCLFLPVFTQAQPLLYRSKIDLRLEDQTVITLFSSKDAPQEYYYLPPENALRIAQSPDGDPEFSFLRYISNEPTSAGGTSGGLLHFRAEWSLSEAREEQIRRVLAEEIPGATLKGVAPLGGKAGVQIVSTMRNDSRQTVIGSGHAPVLPGSKVAFALRLNTADATLLYESLINTDLAELSLIFNYQLELNLEDARGKVRIDWDRYFDLYEQIRPDSGAISMEALERNTIVSITTSGEDQLTGKFARHLAHQYLKSASPERRTARQQGIRAIDLSQTAINYRMPFSLSRKLTDMLDVYILGEHSTVLKSVNLNDALFSNTEIKMILDIESEQLFTDYINFVTVNIRKKRSSGDDFHNTVLIDRSYIETNGLLATTYYARGSDTEDSKFEYQVQWSLRGGLVYPEHPEWQAADGPILTLTAPIEEVEIWVDAHHEAFKDEQLAALGTVLKYSLFGKEEQTTIGLRFSEQKYLTSQKIFLDKTGSDLAYRCSFLHRSKGRIQTDWEQLEDELYFIIPPVPDELKSATGPAMAVSPSTTPADRDDPPAQSWKADRSGKDRALFFAVNDYEQDDHYPDLQNPIKDAGEIAQELVDHYGFQAEIIQNPTRLTIREKLAEYAEKYKKGVFAPEGQLLIFFSGHGEFVQSNGFFIPSDADGNDRESSALAYAIWRPRIDALGCKHILVVIDACYSGTFDQAVAMRSGGGRFGRPDEPSEVQKFYNNHLERTARLYLVSGGKEKTPDKSGFAKKLLDGLRTANPPQGILTSGQLYELYLKQVTPTPLFGEFGADEAGSSFLFIRR